MLRWFVLIKIMCSRIVLYCVTQLMWWFVGFFFFVSQTKGDTCEFRLWLGTIYRLCGLIWIHLMISFWQWINCKHNGQNSSLKYLLDKSHLTQSICYSVSPFQVKMTTTIILFSSIERWIRFMWLIFKLTPCGI